MGLACRCSTYTSCIRVSACGRLNELTIHSESSAFRFSATSERNRSNEEAPVLDLRRLDATDAPKLDMASLACRGNARALPFPVCSRRVLQANHSEIGSRFPPQFVC